MKKTFSFSNRKSFNRKSSKRKFQNFLYYFLVFIVCNVVTFFSFDVLSDVLPKKENKREIKTEMKREIKREKESKAERETARGTEGGTKAMITIRKSTERGISNLPWLNSKHTFSFSDYYDPKHMGFHTLRVINEDQIQAGKGFDKHPHKDMEIISYVIDGSLEHKDSMGNTTIILPNEIQRMSAGTGVLHSEYNHEKNKETHFYQIWIMPNKKGIKPGYAQKSFASDLKKNKLVLVVSNSGRDGSISIEQNLDMYLSRLPKDETLEYEPRKGNKVWVQVVKGKIRVNDNVALASGDGLALEYENLLNIKAHDECELMIFDLGG